MDRRERDIQDVEWEAVDGSVPVAWLAEATTTTVPTGRYRLRFRSARAQTAEGATGPWVRITATAEDLVEGTPRGTVFFDLSAVERRTASGRLARENRLLAQLAKAMGTTTLMETLQAYERVGVIGGWVREVLVSPEGEYLDARQVTDRAGLLASGYEARNYVETLFSLDGRA